MSKSDLPVNQSSRGRKYAFRWALVAALVGLLSLQVTASSHVHISVELQHCDVCLQGSNAPLATKIILPAVSRSPLPAAGEVIVSAPIVAPALTFIRGPPTTP